MESFVSYWEPPQIILDYQDVPRKWSCDTVPVPFKKDYTFKEKCYYTFNFASEYFFSRYVFEDCKFAVIWGDQKIVLFSPFIDAIRITWPEVWACP